MAGAKSEVSKIFESLPKYFQKGTVKTERSFYFSLGDDEKWSVVLTPEKCDVKAGKTDDADCFFKASVETFLEVWSGKKTPGLGDFMSGTIKSNNPMLLKEFVAAFGIGK
jgi:putative sterol carrier protein